MLLGTTIKDRADLYITKELIPELRRWKVDTYQVVSIIYKYSDNTRIQFNTEEDRQIFKGAMDQTAKLATFGFGKAK
ncbi:hypothetical protein BCV71DRAFT_269110 [Rhizopus microsporus]|uniref:Uncharacterized protein n=1 Tax=Rhizopus microsporus TaxID=58291 RepID=A0A1X0RKD7_RHIZD|nr:hypothetical protein BCV71DRAFT_269110 [Rhizopus microsporus]